MHSDLMYNCFGVRPSIFENTEFTFNNEIAETVRGMDFAGIYTEGVDRVLRGRSPNHIYQCRGIPVLLRNTTLSDDIAFRFANRSPVLGALSPDRGYLCRLGSVLPGGCRQCLSRLRNVWRTLLERDRDL